MGPRYGATPIGATPFDDLFERFHFSVREHDPATSSARHAGAACSRVSWTPTSGAAAQYLHACVLVRELVRAALEALLTQAFGLSPRSAAQWVHDGVAPRLAPRAPAPPRSAG